MPLTDHRLRFRGQAPTVSERTAATSPSRTKTTQPSPSAHPQSPQSPQGPQGPQQPESGNLTTFSKKLLDIWPSRDYWSMRPYPNTASPFAGRRHADPAPRRLVSAVQAVVVENEAAVELVAEVPLEVGVRPAFEPRLLGRHVDLDGVVPVHPAEVEDEPRAPD